MTGHKIRLRKGYRLKGGKLIRTTAYLDVSRRLQQKASKRVRVVRPAKG